MSIFDKLADTLTIPSSWVRPLVSLTLFCKQNGKWTHHLAFGKDRTVSLYYNGVFFIRIMLPFYIGLQIRWSGSTTKKAFIQSHIGWRLSGVPALTFRIQSDPSGAISNKGPEYDNQGQASGWECGTK